MNPLIGITGRKDTSARLVNSPMHSVGQTYVRAIQKVGGTPLIIPPVLDEAAWVLLSKRLDGVLFSGGGDIDPTYYEQSSGDFLGGVDKLRDQVELAGLRVMLAAGLPVLGICRGQQVLNVAQGGSLYQDIATQTSSLWDHAYLPARPMEQLVHPVAVEPESKLSQILGKLNFDVNSAHHQAVDVLGAGLRVVATAPDGVIEALELEDYPFCLSVQWHPEAMVKTDEAMYPLFAAFVAAARARIVMS